jgi:predicted RNA-binding protein
MEHVLIFNKVTGKGLDIDILDDGRIIVDKVTTRDFHEI